MFQAVIAFSLLLPTLLLFFADFFANPLFLKISFSAWSLKYMSVMCNNI